MLDASAIRRDVRNWWNSIGAGGGASNNAGMQPVGTPAAATRTTPAGATKTKPGSSEAVHVSGHGKAMLWTSGGDATLVAANVVQLRGGAAAARKLLTIASASAVTVRSGELMAVGVWTMQGTLNTPDGLLGSAMEQLQKAFGQGDAVQAAAHLLGR